MNLKGKVAFITGGTSGIGEATALAFARAGADVVITGRRAKEGNQVAAKVRETGGRATFVQADVTREDQVQHAVQEATGLTGRIDFAFNNAGCEEQIGPITEKTEAIYDQVFDANVKGLFFSLKHEVAAMLKSGGGSIVNNSSIAGVAGMPGVAIYAASKHAVVGMTKSVALEVASQNIRVNAVSPGAVQTAMYERFVTGPEMAKMLQDLHPIGRVGQPEEIAAGVLWLACDGSSFVTGHNLVLDGGFTVR